MWEEIRGRGCLVWMRQEGGRVSFRCERPADGDGLYKVWICGGGGELLLGTLAPAGEKLTLERGLSVDQLRRCGCWPVRGAACRMAYSFSNPRQDTWHWEEHPERLVDGETARAGEWGRMLLCRDGDGFSLACPLDRPEPLALSALFCLARAGTIGGECCLIWRFDRKGSPIFPTETVKNGRST